MNEICAKVYYELSTGNVITITSEMTGEVEVFTKEQDFSRYPQLQNQNINDVDFVELEYGTLENTFKNLKSYTINLKTKALECIYYTLEELNTQLQEELQTNIIQERINTISEYASVDNNSIELLENAVIEYEMNLIMGGM